MKKRDFFKMYSHHVFRSLGDYKEYIANEKNCRELLRTYIENGFIIPIDENLTLEENDISAITLKYAQELALNTYSRLTKLVHLANPYVH